jgi:hypothetical protein
MWRNPWISIAVLLAYTLLLCAAATIISAAIYDGLEGLKDAAALVANPAEWDLTSSAWWTFCGGPVLVLVATQALFLWPVLRGRPEKRPNGRPLMTTIIAASLVGAALTIALAASLFDVYAMATRTEFPEEAYDDILGEWFHTAGMWLPYIMLAVSWIFWSLLLWMFTRRHVPRGSLGRVAGLLLGATIAEVLVVVPIDLMVRRRSDCYCGTASFVSICLSVWALLWLAGPGILLALISRRRRLWGDTHCRACGQAMGPTPGSVCPECGQPWTTLSSQSGEATRRA